MSLVEIRMPEEEKEGTEAAIGTWLKQINDAITENEPLIEISTDKVTLEIASPATGVLRSIRKLSGDAVRPGDLLGTVETESDDETSRDNAQASSMVEEHSSHLETSVFDTQHRDVGTFSPVVRRLLSELGLDPKLITKVSRGGRLTPEDIRAHLADQVKELTSSTPSPVVSASQMMSGSLVPHTPMRRSIARHMAQSVQAAPHVTSVFEADFYHVLADRNRRKESGEEYIPSVTAYIIHAALKAIRVAPDVNSKWHEEHLEVFDEVNFGVGTALEQGGLVVPVIRNASSLTLEGISQILRELTTKARAGKLTQNDLDGGTFTLSNHGVSGSILAAPIILPHGQAAILGTGKLQKRVVVCETNGRELFRIRPMMYVTLTVDHRVLDGQETNRFLEAFVAALGRPESAR